MPSYTTIILALAIASTAAPSLAAPTYESYSYDLARRDEQFARELEYILARAEESGAINFKAIGRKIASGARTAAKKAGPILKAAAPYALQAASMVLREDGAEELFARLE